MSNPFAIDRTYVISVKALREVLKEISVDRECWRVEENKSQSVVISYNSGVEELNNIQFEFPKIADVWLFGDDGEIVCMYPISRETVRRGLYWDKDRLVCDEVKDWEAFWPPIKAAMAKRYSEGGSSKTISISSPPSLSTV